MDDILSKTDIKFIKPYKTLLNNVNDVVRLSELDSDYTDDKREGIVIKTAEGGFVKDFYKVVNKYFNRREDFNEKLIKNKVAKL